MLLTSLGRAIRANKKRFARMADSCSFYFYCGAAFVYLHFRPIPRPRNRNRSPVRTVRRRVRVLTVTSSGIGAANGHACRSGVKFDFQYVSDSLWNIKSEQKERLASWNRFRGTVDIDFGALIGQRGLYFHATALWQGGGILGAYLGLLTSPSGMSSANTCRLDSWWIEKRWLDERITARIGQFAGQDFYG